MLIKRTERQARRGTLVGAMQGQPEGALDRRSFLRRSGLVAGGLAALGALPLASVRTGGGRSARRARRRGHHPQEHLHALLGRLHSGGGSCQRRLDRPGARLGYPDQSRLALRQGRRGARAGTRRPPPEISDEARQRPVDAGDLGEGDRRDRRQADGDPRRSRARNRSTGSARPSSPTRAPISTASSPRSGAPTTSTTRRASAIRPRSRASPIPGATAR